MPVEAQARVAFITGEYPKASETFLLRELRALRLRGLDFVVVATKKLADTPEADGIDAPVLLRPGVFSPRTVAAEVRFACSHPLKYIDMLVRLVLGHRRRPVELLRVLVNVPRALALGYELRRRGVRRVHALWAGLPATLGWIIARALDMEFSFAGHAWDVHVGGRMLREKAELARVVVACSRSVAGRLKEIVGARLAAKVVLVHHGIEPEKLPARSETPTGVILAAGRFEPKKGFEVLIEACAILARGGREVHCVIVGDGPLKERLAALAARAGGATVELVPWMHHDALMQLVASAAVLAAPSVVAPTGDRDGIPNVVLEAMAIGTPVVAADAGGISEVVRDGETGFLTEPDNPAAFADKLGQILDKKWRESDITRRAKELIRHGFTLSDTAVTLEKLLVE